MTTIDQFTMFRRIQTNITKCGFCERYGHHVLTCNDPQLNVMEDMLFHEKENLSSDLTDEERKLALENFILRKTHISVHNLNRWRCFAIRKCMYNNNYIDHSSVWIKKIVDYVFSNERPITQSIIGDTEFIGFDENDAVSYLIDNLIQINNNYNNQRNCYNQKFDIKMDYRDTQNEETKTHECGICYEEKNENKFVKLDCEHKFCGSCFENILKSDCCHGTISCSMCRNPVKNIGVKDETIMNNLKPYMQTII